MGLLLLFQPSLLQDQYLQNLREKFVPNAFDKDSTSGSIASIGETKQFKLEDTPGFGISAFTALFPVILMAFSTIS